MIERGQIELMLAEARAEVRVLEKLLGIAPAGGGGTVHVPYIPTGPQTGPTPPKDILTQLREQGMTIRPPTPPVPTAAIEGPEGTVRILGKSGIVGHEPQGENVG